MHEIAALVGNTGLMRVCTYVLRPPFPVHPTETITVPKPFIGQIGAVTKYAEMPASVQRREVSSGARLSHDGFGVSRRLWPQKRIVSRHSRAFDLVCEDRVLEIGSHDKSLDYFSLVGNWATCIGDGGGVSAINRAIFRPSLSKSPRGSKTEIVSPSTEKSIWPKSGRGM
jgi:hypothetical protein